MHLSFPSIISVKDAENGTHRVYVIRHVLVRWSKEAVAWLFGEHDLHFCKQPQEGLCGHAPCEPSVQAGGTRKCCLCHTVAPSKAASQVTGGTTAAALGVLVSGWYLRDPTCPGRRRSGGREGVAPAVGGAVGSGLWACWPWGMRAREPGKGGGWSVDSGLVGLRIKGELTR